MTDQNEEKLTADTTPQQLSPKQQVRVHKGSFDASDALNIEPTRILTPGSEVDAKQDQGIEHSHEVEADDTK